MIITTFGSDAACTNTVPAKKITSDPTRLAVKGIIVAVSKRVGSRVNSSGHHSNKLTVLRRGNKADFANCIDFIGFFDSNGSTNYSDCSARNESESLSGKLTNHNSCWQIVAMIAICFELRRVVNKETRA
jgi:hypothetical protein